MDIKDYANSGPAGVQIAGFAPCLTSVSTSSPIDAYRSSIRSILNFGTSDLLDSNNFVGGLLAVGVLSASEGYFRSILSSCIEICPIAQEKATDQSICLGGLLWHGNNNFSRSALEHSSFSSKDELKKACSKYIAFTLEDRTFKYPLEEFDKVCQARHGIVHNDAYLPCRNAVRLAIPKNTSPQRFFVRYPQLQEVAAVVNTLVYTFNRELFYEMCKRWAVDWRNRTDWDARREKAFFNEIWKVFHSKDENKRRLGRTNITKTRCMADIKSIYGI